MGKGHDAREITWIDEVEYILGYLCILFFPLIAWFVRSDEILEIC